MRVPGKTQKFCAYFGQVRGGKGTCGQGRSLVNPIPDVCTVHHEKPRRMSSFPFPFPSLGTDLSQIINLEPAPGPRDEVVLECPLLLDLRPERVSILHRRHAGVWVHLQRGPLRAALPR